MFELITFWGFAFIVISVVAGIMSVAYENLFLVAISLAIAIIGSGFVFNMGFLALIVAYPLVVFPAIIASIGIGSIYTIIWRWPSFIREHADSINMSYDAWVEYHKNDDSVGNLTFEKFLASDFYKFNAKDYKTELCVWIIMWPLSLTWELMHKPAIWVWNTVYFGLAGTFQRISLSQAKRINETRNK